MASSTKFLTTGQAALYCSVTPDTVLKWIRSGLLPAHRTAGGHHRIDERDLERLLSIPSSNGDAGHFPSGHRAFRYCWEFKGDGKIPEGCRSCAAYQLRAQRCYEVARLAPDAPHLKLFCSGSCMDCDYYRMVHKQATNVLVVSSDKKMAGSLKKEAKEHDFNLEITDCEYTCSALVNDFRPDFAVVDCSLGPRLSRDICRHLSQDPRIPLTRLILAANEGEFPSKCDKEIFARIQRPFSIRDLVACIEDMLKVSRSSN
ncbi:MAG: helix-turn-helix domain-containing protein [Chitinivibrionia bacterium]|nr:helix-turn-helix domain-containing protein [Chitinivibrionia bacterium]